MRIEQKGIGYRSIKKSFSGFSHVYYSPSVLVKRPPIAQQYKTKLFRTLNLIP